MWLVGNSEALHKAKMIVSTMDGVIDARTEPSLQMALVHSSIAIAESLERLTRLLEPRG